MATPEIFIMIDNDRWYIVENVDHQNTDGTWGMSSIIHGSTSGYATRQDALDALRDRK